MNDNDAHDWLFTEPTIEECLNNPAYAELFKMLEEQHKQDGYEEPDDREDYLDEHTH